MKKNFYTLIFLGLFATGIAQTGNVGINTTTPSATLDVNGNAKIRTTPSSATLTGHQVLGIDATTKEVKSLDPSLFSTNTNTTIYEARKSTGVSLLNLGLFNADYRTLNFVQTDTTVGDPTLITNASNSYTVPSNGVYAIAFNFRFGTGLEASVLSGVPSAAILKTTGTTSTILEEKPFSGLNLIVANVTLSDTHINSLYTLQAGDKISFGLVGGGLLNLGLLGSMTTSFHIYKISN